MSKIKFIRVVVLMLIVPMLSFGQNQGTCYNTVSFCPVGKRMGFTKNMQSFSGAFEMGDTSVVTIVVYKGMEYRISLCSPSHQELEGQFQFKISEKVTKGVWKEETKISYEPVLDDDGYDTGDSTQKVDVIKRRVYET